VLTDEEKREIESHFADYPARRAAVTDALKVVQKHRRWVSDEAVRDIAGLLGMSAEEVDGVATFYSLIYRRPVGAHVILICDSVSCYITGYESVLAHLTARLGIGLGETTSDGRFTLLPVACLGLCDEAPAMMIDDDVHGNLTGDKLDQILDSYK
jgi:NADH-quinone oxidoreductase subunit E